MAVIRQDDAQKLLDQIDLLRKLITEQGTNAHAMSTAIEPSLLSIKQELWCRCPGENPATRMGRHHAGREGERCISGFLSSLSG